MKIKLNDKTGIDLEKLIVSKLLVQANSGGGKSWAIRRIIEETAGAKQIIIIDPEGEFANLCGPYDFIYAGKGGDAPTEIRSAALLARKLLELNASAVIDLYELHPQERKHFVKLFFDAMVNSPKELWHDVLIVLDEAHIFAPEKDQSESVSSVVGMASLGRKRGFCLIPATQRPAKLSKDVAAECNNKLIGRASLDIDRKRASEELGFTSKEQVLSLRDLEPGEFYAFGPAIGRDVQKIKIGDVKVKPAKRGVSRTRRAAPSAKVKKLLGELKDLPQEAAEEARTVADLKTELANARKKITILERAPKEKVVETVDANAIRKAVAKRDTEWTPVLQTAIKEIKRLHGIVASIAKLTKDESIDGHAVVLPPAFTIPANPEGVSLRPAFKRNEPVQKMQKTVASDIEPSTDGPLPKGEKAVLIEVAKYPNGLTRKQVTLMTGYKRSSRDAYIYRLSERQFITVSGDLIQATEAGISALGGAYEAVPTDPDQIRDHWLKTLPKGEKAVFETLIGAYPASLSREEITERTGYSRSSRDAYIYRLSTRQLVIVNGSEVKASDELF